MTKINKTPLYILITAFLSIAHSQSNFEIQQAKKIIKEKNLSVDQVKSIAKSKGYSDEQIETAIEKEKRVDNQDNFTPIDNSAVPKTDETFKNLDSQINIPFFLAKRIAYVFEKLPKPMLTRDQVEMLKVDNVVEKRMSHYKFTNYQTNSFYDFAKRQLKNFYYQDKK